MIYHLDKADAVAPLHFFVIDSVATAASVTIGSVRIIVAIQQWPSKSSARIFEH